MNRIMGRQYVTELEWGKAYVNRFVPFGDWDFHIGQPDCAGACIDGAFSKQTVRGKMEIFYLDISGVEAAHSL